ncbi:RICIN domain-containing protein, partial [Phytohabitans houttuyneae]
AHGDPPPAPAPPAPPRSRRTAVLVVVVAAVAVTLAASTWLVVRGARQPAAPPAPSPPAAALAAGPVRIHPARAPELCLTEGVDRSGRYGSPVAAQRPCAEAEPPVTRVEPVRDGLYFITWAHPQLGVGCLTVLLSGPGRGLLEPWDDCQPSRPIQLFHIEPSAPDRYRIRSAQGDLCLGIREGARDPGAEVVHAACTGAADQEYLIEPRS